MPSIQSSVMVSPALAASSPVPPARRLRPAVFAGIWTIPGLLSCLQAWATNRLAGRPAAFIMICAGQLPAWYLWAALTPVLFRVADIAPPAWPPPRRTVAIHAAAWSACLALHAAVIAGAAILLDAPARPPFAGVWRVAAVSWIPSTFLLYCATIGASAWMRSIERERVRAGAQAELSEARTRAELSALRSQLNPHFLFNALNTVAVLVRAGDATPAERVITQLGAILRELLRTARSHESTLEDEVRLLRQYLEIEQWRFGSALRVQWNIAEECRGALVPTLLLQPLLENAIRHGIARLEDGGAIEITAARRANELSIRVINDGPAADDTQGSRGDELSNGVGLTNTRRRLDHLYGENGRITLNRHDRRAIVEVELPFHVVSPARDDTAPSDTAPAARRD